MQAKELQRFQEYQMQKLQQELA
jgi:uncharacterized protein involved in exopolysaccharide biosynthesis